MRLRAIFKQTPEMSLNTAEKGPRSTLIYIIKKIFENVGVKDEFFNEEWKDSSKPYTVTYFFDKGIEIKNGRVVGKGNFILKFSSGNFEVFSYFYNGIVKAKNMPVEVGTARIMLRRLELVPPKPIFSGVVMKTMAPVVLPRGFEENNEEFVLPSDEDFVEVANMIVRERARHFGLSVGNFDVKPLSGWKEQKIRHYNGVLTAFKGKFLFTGDVNAIRFIYDYGFGLRTGQGFGYLEVISHE